MLSKWLSKIIKQKNNDMLLVITEYPRSGGTWLTTLLGDITNFQKRDLYITEDNLKKQDNFLSQHIYKNPWYVGYNSLEIKAPAIVKSHELPKSPLITFDPTYLHLFRDGRDVVVSKYFFLKDFCVKNNLIDEFNTSFNDFLNYTAQEWKVYVQSWKKEKGIVSVKYEDLLINPEQTIKGILKKFNLKFSKKKVNFAIKDNAKDNFSKKLDYGAAHNTFVRKCIIGDWKNHFSDENKQTFKNIAGDLLIELGYEKDYTW